MKIALLNESSCLSKNAVILRELEQVVKPLGHQVFNYGMSEEDKDYNISYVELGHSAPLINLRIASVVGLSAAFFRNSRWNTLP